MKQQTQEYLYIIKKENNRMGKIIFLLIFIGTYMFIVTNEKQIKLEEQVLYGLFSAFWFITIPVTIIDMIYKKIKE